MPEINRWSGNDTSKFSIATNEFEDLIKFMLKYEYVYLFGNGKIGSAINKYLVDSGYNNFDVITSKDFYRIKELGGNRNSGIIIGVGNQYFDEIMLEIESVFSSERILILSELARAEISSILSVEEFKNNFWINIFVTNKCNLGCKSCSALAPLVKQPVYYEIEQFKKDITRIRDLSFDNISLLNFTGAEAVLHPDFFKMVSFARKIFPRMRFQLYTNGLFLIECADDKIKEFARLNIVLVITEYPLHNLDLKMVYKKLDNFNVEYDVISVEGQKYFSKRPFNLNGDTPKYKYIYCPRYKMCKSLFLFEGRLYKCIYALSGDYVNESIGSEMKLNVNDYIDIYNTSPAKVYEYATRRIPFCGYCSPIEEMIHWEISKKKPEEWL